MEWNWLSGNNNNNLTPFFLSESTGDSEELVKSDVHEKDEAAAMDEQEAGMLFRFSDDQDDDAQSCSYEHLSYTGNMGQDQSQSRLISYDDGDEVVDDDDDDEKKMKNQCESKVMGCSSKQQWRSNNCVHHDPNSNQRESDRKFWEACLTS